MPDDQLALANSDLCKTERTDAKRLAESQQQFANVLGEPLSRLWQHEQSLQLCATPQRGSQLVRGR